MKQTILCVDDEIDNVDALERLFRKDFSVLKAVSGPEALEILKQNPQVNIILSDQRMPNMNGVEFLEKSIESNPQAIRILLTGFTDIESVIAAINSGQIYRYLTKPWDPADLLNTVKEAAEKFKLKSELGTKNLQLQKALSELNQLDQAKSQFMILINHELKTPLTAILSFAELLKETNLDEEQSKYLNRISQNTYRLKDLVDDALKIVSGETGLLKVNLSDVEFKPQTLILWNKSIEEMKRKSQRLVISFNPFSTKADQGLVLEVLNRIIHNATKFGDPNSDIRLEASQTNGHYLFSVENSGPSIPNNIIEKIIKPFTLNEDIMKHSQGNGLGLSVCNAILKNWNSSLEISSQGNQTRVSFKV